MPLHIAHEIRATIEAPIETVWKRQGAFADTSWNPGIASSVLIGDETVPVGAVRVMTSLDGSIIRDRLEALGPTTRSRTHSIALRRSRF